MPTCTLVNVSRFNLDFPYRKVRGGEILRTSIPLGGAIEIYCADDSEAFALSECLTSAGAVEGRVMLPEHEKAWMIYSWGDIKEETALDAAEHNVKAESVISSAATDDAKELAQDANSEFGFDLDVTAVQGRGSNRKKAK